MDACLIFAVGMAAGFGLGALAARASAPRKAADGPDVHVLERRIYWLENIYSAYNQAKRLFEKNPDKVECIELSIQDEAYHANRFYCKYRSKGPWRLDMTLSATDEPTAFVVSLESAGEGGAA